jgi:H+/Cl- antiporter ClcA
VLVGLTIRHLPGRGGESPAEGFKPGGVPRPGELPGIAIAALATLAFGAVLGPEAPLIALGGGLAVCAVRLAKRDTPPSTAAVVAAAGSFAAISTLLGSPLLVVGAAIRRLALLLRPHVERRLLLLTPLVGLAIAGLAIIYANGSGHSSSDVLFSGQDALGPLVAQSAGYSVGALLLLIACKGLAYGLSLSSFRGGPVFPAMFLGTVGGIAALR